MSDHDSTAEHAHGHAESGGGHGHHDHRRRYVVIWGVLLLFTMIEIGITFLPIPRWSLILGLLVFMVAKAALVGLYYMHLISEKAALKWVIVLPGLLGALYAIVLVREAIARW
ncbi:MAG: cytochrome C oxidase subunit IV family protein [Deltaproteobacteria bacterium]|nr:cytochrome C oxidase subunit IV family protein [Deltaproteobacteria bacterium]